MTTGAKVIERLQSGYKAKFMNGVWRSRSPYRADSDSLSFALKVESDGEHGAWTDHASTGITPASGSLYELAAHLGIETPTANGQPRTPVASTKRVYAGLEDYAKAHGVEPDALRAAGWTETTYCGHPALKYPTQGGNRYRLLDAAEKRAKFAHDKGTKKCFYGLRRAVEIARAGNLPLILCNGEISTVSAQARGIPAFCVTSGEGAIPDHLMPELTAAWDGALWIVLDCDDKGRMAAEKVKAQLPHASVIDLLLTDGGDLADWVLLHGDDALANLRVLAGRQTAKAAVQQVIAQGKPEVVAAFDVASALYDDITAAFENPAHVRGLRSGLTELDNMIGGFVGGSYVILGATNMGKSTLATSIVRGFMTQARGLVVPTEMSAKAWCRKLVASMARVDAEKLITGLDVTADEIRRVTDAIGLFSEQKTLFMDITRPTVKSIEDQIYKAKDEGVEWVLVDSFQRLRARNARAAGSYERTLELADTLQELVIGSGLVFVITSQTGRNAKDRSNKRPNVTDAKGGGEIEENADVVLGLYDDDYYVQRFGTTPEAGWPENAVEISNLKARNRPMRVHKVMLVKTPYGFENARVRTFDVQAGKWEDK